MLVQRVRNGALGHFRTFVFALGALELSGLAGSFFFGFTHSLSAVLAGFGELAGGGIVFGVFFGLSVLGFSNFGGLYLLDLRSSFVLRFYLFDIFGFCHDLIS